MLALSAKVFRVNAPRVFNSLSFDCHSAQLASSFQQSMLKTKLFITSYSEHSWLVSTIMCLRFACDILALYRLDLIDWRLQAQHTCHAEEKCPPCPLLTQKWCHGRHELRSNIPCYVAEISCGMPCNRPLQCGIHKCIQTCHKVTISGHCFDSFNVTSQPHCHTLTLLHSSSFYIIAFICLCSASSLIVCRTWLLTVGDLAFQSLLFHVWMNFPKGPPRFLTEGRMSMTKSDLACV